MPRKFCYYNHTHGVFSDDACVRQSRLVGEGEGLPKLKSPRHVLSWVGVTSGS